MDCDFPRGILGAVPLFAPHLETLTCTPLPGGQLNRVFRVTSPAGDHVLRVWRDSLPLDRRRRERANAEAAAALGVAPPVLFADEEQGILVMPFIGNSIGAEAFADRMRIDRVAALLAALHAGPPLDGAFSPFRRLAAFAERCRDVALPEVADRDELMAALARIEAELTTDAPAPVPCHNDPNPHNLIDSPDGMRLVDWEDAAMADPDWEIGCFPVQARLTPDEEIHFFRRCYGDEAAPRARRARLYQCVLRGIHALQALDQSTQSEPERWRADAAGRFADLRRRLDLLERPAPAPAPRAAGDLPTIFVSIASYRDPDCQNTVRDLFLKAAHPERVFVGICWQFVPEDDADCFRVPAPRPDQVRVVEFHASKSRGACWARYQTQSLWRGEDHVFQIDSHMRFAQGWDDLLLDMLAACPSEKAVLSTYPLGFTPPDDLKPPAWVRIHPKGFDRYGVLMLTSTATPMDKAPQEPQRTAFVAAGMLFGPAAALIHDVPYDPYLYFQGEEITLAARLFTHGWDVFIPDQPVGWHDYGKHPARPRHWQDKTDWGSLNDLSCARLRHILCMQPSKDPKATREVERFGLGKARALVDFEALAGVAFVERLVGGMVAYPDDLTPACEGERSGRNEVFEKIWRQNAWKVPETRSGRFATLEATTTVRAGLPQMLEFLGVRTLADAGCGDLNWMADVSAGLEFYFGFDIAADAVSELATRFADRPNHFFRRADVCTDVLPACDAILCRDVLSHLPQGHALAALRKFKESGSRLLIATTHTASQRNPWVAIGGWYPISLTAAPFKLPPPRLLLDEAAGASWGKALGVWRLADLPEIPDLG